MNTKTKIPLTKKLVEFGLCSSNGKKIRNEEIEYDTKNEPIPDEKWKTVTKYMCNLDDLEKLANAAAADYNNWQNIFVLDLVKRYEAVDKDGLERVSLRKILERERENAKWDNVMALFSLIAYRNKEEITDFLKTIGFEDNDILVLNDSKTDTQGFLCRFNINEEKTIAIHAWRGTVSGRNWRTNISTGLLSSILNCSTGSSDNTASRHRGIKRALEPLQSDILGFLNKHTINVLTGHSLGGGLANASVPFLVKNERNIARLTTFGAEKSLSRQGLTELAPKIKAGASRWISHSDPVPYLPPRLDVIGTVFYFDNREGPEKIKNKPPGLKKSMGMWKEENPVRHHDLDCYLFKTRHLEQFLTHILKGGKPEDYNYYYPTPKDE